MTNQPTKLRRLLFVLVVMVFAHAMASATVTVTVSTPSTSTATVTSPAKVVAKATSSSGKPITYWNIYSDGKSVWSTTSDVASISASFAISTGKHQMTIRAWDSSGAYGTQYMTFNVSGTAPSTGSGTSGAPVPPSNAKVISGIETKGPWGHCSDCAANPADPTPPIAHWIFAQFQSTPSINGNSVKMKVTGTQAYGDVLHWIKFGNQNAYRNFIWEFWVNGDNASLSAQNLEFDLFQAVNGRKFMFGSQCNYKKGIWQAWNHISKWVDLPSVPCTKFKPGTWTRVVWYLQRTSDNRMRYISLTVGSKTYTINSYQPSYTSSWGDTFGVQFQQDLDKYATDYTIWVDKVKVSMW